jgi:hypothetical protein
LTLLLHHLDDPDVRLAMVDAWWEERVQLEAAGHAREVYGRHLTDAGWEAFLDTMPAALDRYDETWLRALMAQPSYFLSGDARRTGSGVTALVAINYQMAAAVLCQTEFNTAYVRGMARTLLARGETHCLVYRAGGVERQRDDCADWEGQTVELTAVLAGHRARYWPPPGDPNAFSIPLGPYCNHSIRASG